MLALGLQGSPRKKGNSDTLLSLFMEELAAHGFSTRILDVAAMDIQPCKELIVCEKKGTCPIEDDMRREVYPLLWQADLVVTAAPIFFYNVPAQLKALIDRCQTMWARRYMLKLEDPGRHYRRGFLLSVGATGGKQLFDGVHLTMKYFYDAVGAAYSGSLTYRKIEGRGQIKAHPTMREDVAGAAAELAAGLKARRKLLFACRENACRSQMAAAFARRLGGRAWDVSSAGSQPAPEINPLMVQVMQEQGIDMGFIRTRSLEAALAGNKPDILITMGCEAQCPVLPGVRRLDWTIPDPAGKEVDFMRQVRDDLESRVRDLIQNPE